MTAWQSRRHDADHDTNRIERQIAIDASRQRVWGLVTRPGRWINDMFQIRVVALEPQTYAAFRWRSDGVTRTVDGPTTLIEGNSRGWGQELAALARAVRP